MLALKFNYEQLVYDLCDMLVQAADEIVEHFMNDVGSRLKATDFEEEKAIFDMASKKILSGCVFYAHSILESYGTGSKIDITNESLSDYMSSEFWNPDRRRFAISGRKAGPYRNIFGDEVVSRGKFRGKEIENIVPAKAPSYAIQIAEKRLYQIVDGGGYGFRTLERYANEFFQNLDTSKYFYNVEV